MTDVLASAGGWPSRVVVGGFRQTFFQLACIGLPFLLLALLLQWLEGVSQGRLSARFGWRSVLWTGWLGTPVHELSHAAVCPVFQHKVKEIALFRPDRASGRLGYVEHTYDPKNPYHVIGNFFIGVAPLAGGSIILYGLLWLFFPGAARQALSAGAAGEAVSRGNVLAAAGMLLGRSVGVFARVVSVQSLTSWRFWVFMYLALCVGSYMAPSTADMRGGKKGAWLLLASLLAFNLLYLALGGNPGGVEAVLASVVGPALALFALSAVLSGAATLVVVGITEVI